MPVFITEYYFAIRIKALFINVLKCYMAVPLKLQVNPFDKSTVSIGRGG